MGNNYPTFEGWRSIVNYNLELLFEAMNHVEFNIHKSLMQMDENEMQQLGHCFFAAYAPLGEVIIESQNQTTTATNQTETDIPF